MRLTDANGQVYKAHFQHVTYSNGRTRATICHVHAGECVEKVRPCVTTPLYRGVAECSPRDQFNKATGRKIAFTHAIQTLPRDVRTGLWAAYLAETMPMSDQDPTQGE